MANTMLPILQFLTENQANSLQRLCNLKGPMPPESGILKALFDGHKHEDVKKELLGLPLDSELWQEYEFGPKDDRTIYRILNPVTLYIGNTTARVLDRDGIVHCVPAVGHEGCVLRWKPRPGANPCDF